MIIAQSVNDFDAAKLQIIPILSKYITKIMRSRVVSATHHNIWVHFST